jgi:hypothetical protein
MLAEHVENFQAAQPPELEEASKRYVSDKARKVCQLQQHRSFINAVLAENPTTTSSTQSGQTKKFLAIKNGGGTFVGHPLKSGTRVVVAGSRKRWKVQSVDTEQLGSTVSDILV